MSDGQNEIPVVVREAIESVEWIATSGWEYFAAKVESPIEALLLAEIFAAQFGVQAMHGLTVLGRVYTHGEARFLCGHGVICYPQAHIGDYRADFLFDVEMPGCAREIFVVECDGYAFHDRTRDQVERDKQRDRFMAARGIRVLRFTGREIYDCPRAVWEEIMVALTAGRGRQWRNDFSRGAA